MRAADPVEPVCFLGICLYVPPKGLWSQDDFHEGYHLLHSLICKKRKKKIKVNEKMGKFFEKYEEKVTKLMKFH